MCYRIEFTRHADRQLRALPASVQRRMALRIDALADDPRPAGALQQAESAGLYRLRVGGYRAIYSIQDDRLLVPVVKVGHRREVYR